MSLDARGLTLARGARCLFSDLSFTVPAGSALRVTGANGAGKTSLLRVLGGLSRPDAGKVEWRGASMASHRANGAADGNANGVARVLYAGHADAVNADLLAWENVAFSAFLIGPDRRAQALQALSLMDLRAQAVLPVRALSQGQRKRVGLARLHLAAPGSLWILDEPFSFLDAAAAASLGALLEQHCAAGGTLVYTTHQDDTLRGAATLELGPAAARTCAVPASAVLPC